MTNDVHPLVTIAIPTYNRADDYLEQALESALNQTYSNIEIIVSDNCSPDNTETVVKGFSDPRIRYFRQTENIGANNNFNFCIEQARGVYFLLLQDDDMIDNDFVEVCMKSANYDTGIGIIRTGTRVIDSGGNVLRESLNRVGGLSTADFFIGWFKGKTAPYLCSTLFNTKRLTEIGGFGSKHNLFQDVVAEVQLAARFGRVDVYDVKASFREHGSEMTAAVKASNWCEDSLFLLDVMCELVLEDRARVRREGMKYFTWLNYNFARKTESPFERLATYLVVYRKFGYRYSPIYFYVYKKGLRRMRRIAGRVKRVLTRVAARNTQ